jgi:hypothetical protein
MTTITQLNALLKETVPYLETVADLRNGDVILTVHPEVPSLLIVGVYANGTFLTVESSNGYKQLALLKDSKDVFYILGRQELWKRYLQSIHGFNDVALVALKKAFKGIPYVTFEQVFFAEDISDQDCLIEFDSGCLTIGPPLKEYKDVDTSDDEPDKNVSALATRIRVIG